MEHVPAFPAKLAIALRATSLSRVALAQELQVDKSLVGRWISGAVHPTEHNLSRLTAAIGSHREGFRLADWFLALVPFAALFGVEVPAVPAPPPVGQSGLAGPLLGLAREDGVRRGAAYEGFWRTSRPSMLMPDQIFHDYGMIRQGTGGVLEVRMFGSGLSFEGWMLPAEGNLFVILHDPVGQTPMSLVFKGVTLPKATVLDGLLLLAALDANRTPGAIPILLERIGDLSGDCAADDLRCAELAELDLEPFDPVPPELVQRQLYRDCGPAAAQQGGELFLSIRSQDSLSRGVTRGGLSG